jgi:hypothetical protein
MRPKRTSLAGVLALLLATGGDGAAIAHADICIVVDPVVALCQDTPTPSPGSDGSRQASAPPAAAS